MLLKEREPSKIRRRLADFYDAAIYAAIPETTRLAKTIQAWWPAILAALTRDVSNARTEGFNRVIKHTERVGCGYRSIDNYQRRLLSHIAVTRPQRSAARMGLTLLKFVKPVWARRFYGCFRTHTPSQKL
jgi:transposase